MASIAATEQDPSRSEEDAHKVVERSNLLNMVKLAIKGLIESAMKDGKVLDDSHSKLQQLCIVLEYVVDHRLKGLTWTVYKINLLYFANSLPNILHNILQYTVKTGYF